MRVLITGGRDRTAQPIVQALTAAHHHITTFDLAPTDRPHALSGNIAHLPDTLTAVPNHEAILHLAVAVGADDYQTPDIPFATNVKGTYNLFEAARRHQIGRIVLTSSAPVHLQHAGAIDPQRPLPTSPEGDHLYDLTKMLQKQIARDFCETYGMTAVVLRLGHLVNGEADTDPQGKPLSEVTYCRDGWMSTTDVAQACLHALTAELSGYHVFNVIGAHQARTPYNIHHTEQTLNFTFHHTFQTY